VGRKKGRKKEKKRFSLVFMPELALVIQFLESLVKTFPGITLFILVQVNGSSGFIILRRVVISTISIACACAIVLHVLPARLQFRDRSVQHSVHSNAFPVWRQPLESRSPI
jgi:hypothetical protein